MLLWTIIDIDIQHCDQVAQLSDQNYLTLRADIICKTYVRLYLRTDRLDVQNYEHDLHLMPIPLPWRGIKIYAITKEGLKI